MNNLFIISISFCPGKSSVSVAPVSVLRIYFNLSLSLSFWTFFPWLFVLLQTLPSFFFMKLWLANFLEKGQI